MKTNRRGFLKGAAAGLVALWSVDPSKILKEPEPESEPEPVSEEEYEIRHFDGPYFLAGGVSLMVPIDHTWR